jgi:SH3 domain-containing protein
MGQRPATQCEGQRARDPLESILRSSMNFSKLSVETKIMKATSSLISSRYLSVITFLAFSFGLILTGQLSTQGNLFAVEKKTKVKPTTFLNTEDFSAQCDSVWASTLQTFTAKGFIPITKDRQGGVMNFTLGVNARDYTNISYVKQYTKDSKAGFGNFWDGFRIESALVLMSSENDGCHCEIKFRYAGFADGLTSRGFGTWHQLESNNFFESLLLSEIGSKLGKKSSAYNAQVQKEQEPQPNNAVVQDNDDQSDIAYVDCGNKLKEVPVNSSSSGLKSLKCGKQVKVVGTEGAWTKIQTEANKEGFVSSRFLSKEKPKN